MENEKLVKLIEKLTPEQAEATKKYITALLSPPKTLTPWKIGRCCGNTAKYHSQKYKHWGKRVTSIDVTKSDGYAFEEGKFIRWGKQIMAGVGDCFLEHCGGSYLFWMITDDEHCEEIRGTKNGFCDFILKCKMMMDKASNDIV